MLTLEFENNIPCIDVDAEDMPKVNKGLFNFILKLTKILYNGNQAFN